VEHSVAPPDDQNSGGHSCLAKGSTQGYTGIHLLWDRAGWVIMTEIRSMQICLQYVLQFEHRSGMCSQHSAALA